MSCHYCKATLAKGNNFNFRTNFNATTPPSLPVPRNFDFAPLLPILLVLVCVGLIIAIIFTALRFISEGALICAALQVETSGETTGRSAWNVGWQYALRLFLISFLLDLTIALPALIGAAIAVVPLFGALNSGDRNGPGALIGLLFVCLCPLVCVLVVVGIVLHYVAVLAHRGAMLEGLGVMDSIRRGWTVLRAHVAQAIILAVLLFVIDLVSSLVLAIPILIIAAPIALTQGPELLRGNVNVGALAIAGCLLFIVGIIVNFLHGIVNTFTSSAWTLAYRAWLAQPVAPMVTAPAPTMS